MVAPPPAARTGSFVMTEPSPTARMPIPDAIDPATQDVPPASGAPTGPPAAPPTPPPAWVAPSSEDTGRTGAVVFGLILVVVGLWFFADRTLGLDMPDVSWGQLWPIALIAIGAWVLLGSMRRRR